MFVETAACLALARATADAIEGARLEVTTVAVAPAAAALPAHCHATGTVAGPAVTTRSGLRQCIPSNRVGIASD